MLIDDITIKVSSGDGGRGAVAFDNNKMGIGPTGGNGGKGGSVYFEGVSDLGALRQFRFKKVWRLRTAKMERQNYVTEREARV